MSFYFQKPSSSSSTKLPSPNTFTEFSRQEKQAIEPQNTSNADDAKKSAIKDEETQLINQKDLSQHKSVDKKSRGVKSTRKAKRRLNRSTQEYLPNPNALFTKPNQKRAKISNMRNLQSEIQSAVLSSLNKVTPDQAKKVSRALSTEVDQKCRQIAQYNFINSQQNVGMGQNPYQSRYPSENDMMQMQFNQFMQISRQNQIQFIMLMQTNALFMQQLMQMQREQESSSSSSSSSESDSDSDSESSSSDSD